MPAALARLAHPARCLGIADEVEEPSKQGEAIASPEAESCGMTCKDLREGGGVVIDGADRVRRDLSHGIRPLVVSKQVIGDSRRQRDRQAAQPDPLAMRELPLMETNVGTAGLPARGKGEVMLIRRKIADTVESCR